MLEALACLESAAAPAGDGEGRRRPEGPENRALRLPLRLRLGDWARRMLPSFEPSSSATPAAAAAVAAATAAPHVPERASDEVGGRASPRSLCEDEGRTNVPPLAPSDTAACDAESEGAAVSNSRRLFSFCKASNSAKISILDTVAFSDAGAGEVPIAGDAAPPPPSPPSERKAFGPAAAVITTLSGDGDTKPDSKSDGGGGVALSCAGHTPRPPPDSSPAPPLGTSCECE